MARRITVIAALLACAAAAPAVLAPFPHGKTTSYQYQTTVAATTRDEETFYSSQFVMQGTLYVTHDNRDPELTNAYSVSLSNVKTDMHNGDHVNYDGKPAIQPIDAKAAIIQKPFLIIYNANGIFDAVKVDPTEPEWSKNMKMAMASMLQLDLPNIKAANPTNELRSFSAQEKTIHGDCMVTYNVYPKETVDANVPEQILGNTTYTPMNCSGFAIDEFRDVDYPKCKAKKEPRMFTDSTKTYEIEKQDGGVVIKKLVADSHINVLSSNGASYPHFVITKTTFKLLQVKEKSDTHLGNFVNWPITRDVTYPEPKGSYASDAAFDVTQGRHVVDLKEMPIHLEKLLVEALSYFEENRFEPKAMDWGRSQTMHKIMHLMSYMDENTLQASYAIFEDMVHPRAGPMKKLFLDVLSQVGTSAACIFTRNLIVNNAVPNMTALEMLTKLPHSVRRPSSALLAQMDALLTLDGPSVEVKKAGVLSYSTLFHRTYKRLSRSEAEDILSRTLQVFFNRIKEEPSYEMKIVFLMAMKNIEIGGIHNILEPIINGTLAISKSPENLRLLSIWAIDQAVAGDYESAHRILWPVMVNDSLPTKLRLAAYDILVNQLPDEDSAMKLHQYVHDQENHHFYNYHYRTLDVIAKSVDQCKADVRTFARTILKNISWPPKSHENIRYTLSEAGSVGYVSQHYVQAEEIEYGVIVNELTGIPEVMRLKHVSIDDDGPVSDFEIQVHVETLTGIADIITGRYHYVRDDLSDIEKLLKKAAEMLPAAKDFQMDIILMRKGRVFMVNHYDIENIENIVDDVIMTYYYKLMSNLDFNYQSAMFDRMSEKRMTSDVGIPVMVNNRIATLKSLKVSLKNSFRTSAGIDLAVEFKSWKHSDSSMSVYNPMRDVWHAVRANTAVQFQLPLRVTLVRDRSTGTLSLVFPERGDKNPDIVGLTMRGNHLVAVDEDRTQALKESCPTCLQQQVIRDGTEIVGITEEYRKRSYDSKDVGLEFTWVTWYGEGGWMSEADYGYTHDWDRSYKSNVSNRWNDMYKHDLMTIVQWWKYIEMDTLARSRGGILKLEPSAENAISHIDVRLGEEHHDFDRNETNSDILHAERFKMNATIDVIASRSNTTVRSWDLSIGFDLGRNHLANEASVKITRKTPEEMDFKICMNAKKNYPAPPKDDLMIGGETEEIDSKFTIMYGYTNEENCARNDTLVKIVLKAELSDEQKNRLKVDMKNSPCSSDKKNIMHAIPDDSIPRTINCVDEAIRYTTPRKYNIDVVHEKLSKDIAHALYHLWTNGMEPKENGNFKLQAEFPMDKNIINFHLMDDNRTFIQESYSMNDLLSDGRGPVMKPLYDFPLDNTRFPMTYLAPYIDNDIRICTVYPFIVITPDSDYVPFNMPSDQWTLISGDHSDNKFAIFANQPRPNYLSFVVSIKGHSVRFYTRESDNVLVAVADEAKLPADKGFRVPLDEDLIWKLKIVKRNDNFVVRFRYVPLELIVGPNYMTVSYLSHLRFQGYVSGLCGHLNGTSMSGNSEILSLPEMPKSI